MSIKKLLLTVLITLILVCSFSISSSAAEPLITYDGVSEDGKVHFNVDISEYQPYCYATAFHIQNNNKWYLALIYFDSFNSGFSPLNIDVSLGRFSFDNNVILGVYSPTASNIGTSHSICFTQDGIEIATKSTITVKKVGWQNGLQIMSRYSSSLGLNSDPIVDYLQPIFNTCYYDGEFYSATNNFAVFSGKVYSGSNSYDSLPISSTQGFYYETADGLTNFHGTDLGSLVEGSGIIEPVYDDNGNIINYNYNYQIDFGDAEDYNNQDVDDYNSKIDNYNVDTDDFDNLINSDNQFDDTTSIGFWYGLVDEYVTENEKIFGLFISILLMSVIVFLIGKKV